MEKYKKIVERLQELKCTIATMESCTGGSVASEITNHPGASLVLRFSAVTYSNEYKIKMGVSSEVIDKYSVYSMETAVEMAKNISKFANSDYGVGITGKINNADPANDFGANDKIFVAIYDRNNDTIYNIDIDAISSVERIKNKEHVISIIGDKLLDILS